MKAFKRTLSFLFAVLMIFLHYFCVWAEEADTPEEEIPTEPVITMSIYSPTEMFTVGKKLALSVNTDEKVSWSSSDETIATVDEYGVVTGIGVGQVKIFAKSLESEQSADITLFVANKQRFWRDLLSERQILSYMYEYNGDYYYTNDKDCWQKHFGFNFVYDALASLYYLEYDFVRVFFTYEGLDWMIQMWKGQYGFVFYGSEVGVYTKDEGADYATKFSHYNTASEENYLDMETTLYRRNKDASYSHVFSREYGKYWWCTGFVPGHLRDTTPCDELRNVTHITLKSEEMAKLFTDGLLDCGFTEVDNQDKLIDDSFFVDGKDVYLQWQNVSEAANHTMVQASFWSFVGFNGFILASLMGISLLVFSALGALFFFI